MLWCFRRTPRPGRPAERARGTTGAAEARAPVGEAKGAAPVGGGGDSLYDYMMIRYLARIFAPLFFPASNPGSRVQYTKLLQR